jgi:hypothetical protein
MASSMRATRSSDFLSGLYVFWLVSSNIGLLVQELYELGPMVAI